MRHPGLALLVSAIAAGSCAKTDVSHIVPPSDGGTSDADTDTDTDSDTDTDTDSDTDTDTDVDTSTDTSWDCSTNMWWPCDRTL
jgi:hypothetical protein